MSLHLKNCRSQSCIRQLLRICVLIYNVVMSKCRYCGKAIPDGELYCCPEHEKRHAMMHNNRDHNIIGVVICLLIAVLFFFMMMITNNKLFIGLAIIAFGVMIAFMNGINVGDYYTRLFTTQRSDTQEKWHEEKGIFRYLSFIVAAVIIIIGILIIIL